MHALRQARTPRGALRRVHSEPRRPSVIVQQRLSLGARRISSQSPAPKTLREFGYRILTSADPSEKASLTISAAEWWQTVSNKSELLGDHLPPAAPSRPAQPLLYAPREMPRSNAGSSESLLHNLAHIELNAVDIGWDTVLRYQENDVPTELFTDWLSILADEARHFHLLDARMRALDTFYGAQPAHNNLWRVAEQTASSLIARIAMVQLVQEARGLDSHERLVSKFYGAKDHPSAKLIDQICKEEVRHVHLGVKWFKHLCEKRGLDPVATFHGLVEEHVELKRLPPPFNTRAREAAGLPESWYIPLSLQRKIT